MMCRSSDGVISVLMITMLCVCAYNWAITVLVLPPLTASIWEFTLLNGISKSQLYIVLFIFFSWTTSWEINVVIICTHRKRVCVCVSTQHETAAWKSYEVERGPWPHLPPDPHWGEAQHQLGQHDGREAGRKLTCDLILWTWRRPTPR